MNLSKARKGEMFVLSEVFLFSLFPVVTIISYFSLQPVVSLAWSGMFSCLFFGVMMLIKGRARELFTPGIYKYAIIIAISIGWLYYGLYFAGLKYTTAGNASIIVLMELFFSYIFFNIWKKEEFSRLHTLGAFLMLIGAVVILFPKQGISFHAGDWIVLFACIFTPIGNFYQQKLRKQISSETVLFLRSLLSFPFFFLLAYFLRFNFNWQSVHGSIWFLALNGLVILGLAKVFWIEGIHRISVTKGMALGCVGPLFTLFFAYLLLHQSPTAWQLIAFLPSAAGLILLTYEKTPAAAA